MKNLYRSKKNKIFFGVVGGLVEYFKVDPTILRLFWLFWIIFTGFFPGLFFYLVSALVIPQGK